MTEHLYGVSTVARALTCENGETRRPRGRQLALSTVIRGLTPESHSEALMSIAPQPCDKVSRPR